MEKIAPPLEKILGAPLIIPMNGFRIRVFTENALDTSRSFMRYL